PRVGRPNARLPFEPGPDPRRPARPRRRRPDRPDGHVRGAEPAGDPQAVDPAPPRRVLPARRRDAAAARRGRPVTARPPSDPARPPDGDPLRARGLSVHAIDDATARCCDAVRRAAHGTLALPNRNLDPGGTTHAGAYEPAGEAYAGLLAKRDARSARASSASTASPIRGSRRRRTATRGSGSRGPSRASTRLGCRREPNRPRFALLTPRAAGGSRP